MLPLLPLTESGAEPEVMQEMVTTLEEAGEIELLALAYAFGGLVSGNEAYNEWFKRSFAMLEDILEESWTYQEMIKKGMQKGLEKGLEKGREEERQQKRTRRRAPAEGARAARDSAEFRSDAFSRACPCSRATSCIHQ